MRPTGREIVLLTMTLVIPTTVSGEIDESILARELHSEVNLVDRLQPWIGKSLHPRTRRSVTSAFELAVERLRDQSGCRSLFEDLGADGLDMMQRSLYYQVALSREQTFCRRTSAYTQVGARVTRLCRSFSRLRANQAAVVLIHEALHQAGMTEKPMDPQALDSGQINQLVRDRCDL